MRREGQDKHTRTVSPTSGASSWLTRVHVRPVICAGVAPGFRRGAEAVRACSSPNEQRGAPTARMQRLRVLPARAALKTPRSDFSAQPHAPVNAADAQGHARPVPRRARAPTVHGCSDATAAERRTPGPSQALQADSGVETPILPRRAAVPPGHKVGREKSDSAHLLRLHERIVAISVEQRVVLLLLRGLLVATRRGALRLDGCAIL